MHTREEKARLKMKKECQAVRIDNNVFSYEHKNEKNKPEYMVPLQDYDEIDDYYNKIATCVLENVSVDYTPGGVKSFADGAPTQITMGLTFKETELLTKEKIDKGF